MFLLHDLEEIATVESWTRTHRDVFPEPIRAHLPVSTADFTVGVAIIFAIFLLASAVDAPRVRAGKAPRFSLVLIALLVLNAFTHVLQAIVMRGYTPGVVTSILLVIPYGWLVWTSHRDTEAQR